jgi:hypothetical protein
MTFHGHNRRSEKPGRREEDYTTCPFHEGTCSDIQNLEKTMMPRWVILWVGGPLIATLLGLGLYNASRGNLASERLIKLEVGQEAQLANMTRLMKHFDLIPVTMKEINKEGGEFKQK